jgi:hypothetical protein
MDASNRAGFTVDVHVLEGIKGHIGQGRAKGYALGNHPYVTCVDDDDYLLPDAFKQMHGYLAQGVSVLCTPELVEFHGRSPLQAGLTRHHLIAYRRDQIIDHSQWPCCGDVAQLSSVRENAIDLVDAAYVHRIYSDSSARILRRDHPGELEKARA